MFEPFVRGSRPTEEGTGLGLSIVKRIVERLKGSVTLENVPKSGLRVTVAFPPAGGGPRRGNKKAGVAAGFFTHRLTPHLT